MIRTRKEGEGIRQGFNFYPLWDEGSFGCQMLFWDLRVEVRWSKRKKKLHLRCWMRTYDKPPEGGTVYIPGYTEQLKELYEKRFGWDGKTYEDWVRVKDTTPTEEKQPIESKSKRYRFTAWVK